MADQSICTSSVESDKQDDRDIFELFLSKKRKEMTYDESQVFRSSPVNEKSRRITFQI